MASAAAENAEVFLSAPWILRELEINGGSIPRLAWSIAAGASVLRPGGLQRVFFRALAGASVAFGEGSFLDVDRAGERTALLADSLLDVGKIPQKRRYAFMERGAIDAGAPLNLARLVFRRDENASQVVTLLLRPAPGGSRGERRAAALFREGVENADSESWVRAMERVYDVRSTAAARRFRAAGFPVSAGEIEAWVLDETSADTDPDLLAGLLSALDVGETVANNAARVVRRFLGQTFRLEDLDRLLVFTLAVRSAFAKASVEAFMAALVSVIKGMIYSPRAAHNGGFSMMSIGVWRLLDAAPVNVYSEILAGLGTLQHFQKEAEKAFSYVYRKYVIGEETPASCPVPMLRHLASRGARRGRGSGGVPVDIAGEAEDYPALLAFEFALNFALSVHENSPDNSREAFWALVDVVREMPPRSLFAITKTKSAEEFRGSMEEAFGIRLQ